MLEGGIHRPPTLPPKCPVTAAGGAASSRGAERPELRRRDVACEELLTPEDCAPSLTRKEESAVHGL